MPALGVRHDPAHPNPPYKKHDFGYTVGGPVYIPIITTRKKKTFFFWSEDGGAKRTFLNLQTSV